MKFNLNLLAILLSIWLLFLYIFTVIPVNANTNNSNITPTTELKPTPIEPPYRPTSNSLSLLMTFIILLGVASFIIKIYKH